MEHNKILKGYKATFQLSEVKAQLQVRNLTPRKGAGKLNSFKEQNMFIIQ